MAQWEPHSQLDPRNPGSIPGGRGLITVNGQHGSEEKGTPLMPQCAVHAVELGRCDLKPHNRDTTNEPRVQRHP